MRGLRDLEREPRRRFQFNRRFRVKSRILAIVDKKRNRSSISGRMAVGSFAAVLTSLALCSIAQLIASDSNKNPVKTEPSATSSASGDVEIAVKLIQFDSSKAEDIEKLFSEKFHPGVSKVFIEQNLIPILEVLRHFQWEERKNIG